MLLCDRRTSDMPPPASVSADSAPLSVNFFVLLNLYVMKRFLPVVFAAAALFLTACRPSVEDVSTKIIEGKELSQLDYTVVLERSTDIMQQLSDSLDKYQSDPEGLVSAMRSMAAEYPESNSFQQAIENADTAKLDKDNRALYLKFEKMYLSNTERIQDLIMQGMRGVVMEKDLGGGAGSDRDASTDEVVDNGLIEEQDADSIVPASKMVKK